MEHLIQRRFPEVVEQLRHVTRDLVERHVLPVEHAISRTGQVPDEIRERLRSLGYYGLTIPEANGGSGLQPLGFAAVIRELARSPKVIWSPVLVSNFIGSKPLLRFGTNRQQQRYLPASLPGRR